MDIEKNKKILLAINTVILLVMAVLAFFLVGISNCTQYDYCAIATASALCFPLSSLLAIFSLIKNNAYTTSYLWLYSVILLILIFPIGTAIGAYQMRYLWLRDKSES